jgi:hypothetical protein
VLTFIKKFIISEEQQRTTKFVQVRFIAIVFHLWTGSEAASVFTHVFVKTRIFAFFTQVP